MSNNSTAVTVQGDPNCRWISQVVQAMDTPILNYFDPICVSLAVFGRLLSLLAFYKQAKKEPAYFYQVALTISEVVENFTYAALVIARLFKFGTLFKASYGWVWYSSRMSLSLDSMTYMISRLLAVCMAADRVLAVWKPMIYNNLNHKRFRIAAVVLSICLGVSTSVFECFRSNYPEWKEATKSYTTSTNTAFFNNAYQILSSVRSILEGCTFLALVAFNVALVRIYRKRAHEISRMTGQSALDKTKKRKAEMEQVLTLIALSQCFFGSLIPLGDISYYTYVAVGKPTINGCSVNGLFGVGLNFIYGVSTMGDFYVILIVSKQFRRLIFDSISCLNRVAPFENSP